MQRLNLLGELSTINEGSIDNLLDSISGDGDDIQKIIMI